MSGTDDCGCECGCLGPALLVPDLGPGVCSIDVGDRPEVAGIAGAGTGELAWRVSSLVWRGGETTSLGGDPPWGTCGCGAEDVLPLDATPQGAFAIPVRYVSWGLNQAATEIATVWKRIRPAIPGAFYGPGYVNVVNGNVSIKLTLPLSGPFEPYPVFTYNSLAAGESIQFGFGVSDLYNPVV